MSLKPINYHKYYYYQYEIYFYFHFRSAAFVLENAKISTNQIFWNILENSKLNFLRYPSLFKEFENLSVEKMTLSTAL